MSLMKKNNSPILGIGIDIIEVDRLKDSIDRQKAILDKLFTKNEIAYCKKYKNPYQHFAARFSSKEAIVKAFGTGFGKKISLHDIEIKNDSKKKPYPVFSKKINKIFNNPTVLISISHSKNFASAVAIWIS